MFLRFILLVLVQGLLGFALPPKSARSLKDHHLVTTLPGLYENIPKDEIPLMFSGQLELYAENKTYYYFWKFSDIHKLPENKNRTTFWLNGGPGCSSMDGALMEAGPFRINSDKKVTYNSGSWHKASDLVFVDQPGGTGFSLTDEYDTELYQITNDFLRFLDLYFEEFPEDRGNELFIAGESYAGQYIPYIAQGILKRNKNLKDNEMPLKLKGLLIGNGWISPNEQGLSYVPYSVQAGIISPDHPDWLKILHQHEQCQDIVNKIDPNDKSLNRLEMSSNICDRILTLILEATIDKSNPDEACYNLYDYTLKDSFPSCGANWPPDLSYVTPFLGSNAVMNALNLDVKTTWQECSGGVGRSLKAKNSIPSVHLLGDILKEVPVILFNGNRDIICNYMGTESFIKKMEWNGQKGFSNDEVIDWIHNNVTAGYIRAERNLTFINVFDSSHMVPFDKPEVSRALLDIMTGNYDQEDKAYVTYPLGERYDRLEEENRVKENKPIVSSSSISMPASTSGLTMQASESSEPNSTTVETDSSGTGTRITRLIQLLVIVVLIWGVYILYTSYKSGPSSIIKSGPSNGRKKNVQWADQLSQFEDDEQFTPTNQGFFAKTFSKFTNSDGGNYSQLNKYSEDIELGDQDPAQSTISDDFIIASDDEDERMDTPATSKNSPN